MKKNLMTIMVAVVLIGISANAEAFIRIQIGERVQIINNLRHDLVVSYSPMFGQRSSIKLSPGQIAEVSGLRGGEYLIGQVFDQGEIIGSTTYRIRTTTGSRRRPRPTRTQLWQVRSFRRLR